MTLSIAIQLWIVMYLSVPDYYAWLSPRRSAIAPEIALSGTVRNKPLSVRFHLITAMHQAMHTESMKGECIVPKTEVAEEVKAPETTEAPKVELSPKMQAILNARARRTAKVMQSGSISDDLQWALLACVMRTHPELSSNDKAIDANANVVWQLGVKRPTPKQVTCYSSGATVWNNVDILGADDITDEDIVLGELLAAEDEARQTE